MEKPLTCRVCGEEKGTDKFSSFHIWSDAQEDMIKYYRGECRECYAARAYMKKNKAFETKLSADEQKNLRLVWRSHRTGTSYSEIYRTAELKMAYSTFLKYVRSGEVEKWYSPEAET